MEIDFNPETKRINLGFLRPRLRADRINQTEWK